MLTNKTLRSIYQSGVIYNRLSLWELTKAHDAKYILASLELWNRGLLNIKAINYTYPGLNTKRIQASYELAKKRGY